MEWAKVLSFVWEKVLFYREVKLLITFSGTFFKLQELYAEQRCCTRNSDTKNIQTHGKSIL